MQIENYGLNIKGYSSHQISGPIYLTDLVVGACDNYDSFIVVNNEVPIYDGYLWLDHSATISSVDYMDIKYDMPTTEVLNKATFLDLLMQIQKRQSELINAYQAKIDALQMTYKHCIYLKDNFHE